MTTNTCWRPTWKRGKPIADVPKTHKQTYGGFLLISELTLAALWKACGVVNWPGNLFCFIKFVTDIWWSTLASHRFRCMVFLRVDSECGMACILRYRECNFGGRRYRSRMQRVLFAHMSLKRSTMWEINFESVGILSRQAENANSVKREDQYWEM